MKPYFRIAVFDLDGTLLDTSEGILASVKYTIKKHGLPELSDDVLKTFIGPPIQNSFAKVYGLEGEILQELATTFRDRYKEYDLLKAIPYDGIYEVFDSLQKKGIKTAVATYKRQDYAEKILRHFHFDDYTEILYGADHENKLKKRDIIELALKDSGVYDFSEAIMIGDSDNDAIGARDIGAAFVGVTYGFGFKQREDVFEYPAIAAVDTTQELKKVLLEKMA